MGLFHWLASIKSANDLKPYRREVARINALGEGLEQKTLTELQSYTPYFREHLESGMELDELLPEAFAVVREVAKRTIGLHPYDVQLLGGMVLHRGNIAEMKTGEGKTLVATLPLYLHALLGKGAHLVTVNDYLAKRDAQTMGPIYLTLGMSVGVVNQERRSYRLEWEDESTFQTRLVPCARQLAYAADITYATNNEIGFDYLRDNMIFDTSEQVQRPFQFAIVDEADSILIDESRTPLIISGPSEVAVDTYYQINHIIPHLKRAELNDKEEILPDTGDFALYEKNKGVALSEEGVQHVERLLGITDIYSPKHSNLIHYIDNALRAHHFYHKDVDYVVENSEVIIVDEFTGRKMPGRRWSNGLHQAIEAKEKLKIQREYQTLATVTFQNLFRMYETLSGMTGTAETEAAEFYSIYKTDVIVVPTNKPVIRVDHADKVFVSKKGKFNAIVKDVIAAHAQKQPVLLGTVSVEHSEELSLLLKQASIPHNVLNAKYHEKEADIIALAGQAGAVTIATNMAGRGTDIKLGEGTIEAGGLLVLGSERHESRRIDNQLRGRSGRQGDPGSSTFYVSIEDDLMRLFGMDTRMKSITAMGWKEDENIQSHLLSRGIAQAQKRIESRNFEMRKNLLEYDNVMNEQRTFVYTLRKQIINLHKNPELIYALVKDAIQDYFEFHPDARNPDALYQWMVQHFQYENSELQDIDLRKSDKVETLSQALHAHLTHRFADIPQDIIHRAAQMVFLDVLDNKWREHLLQLDHIRDGIGLRGYAQKNPIVEYKLEASHAFHLLKINYRLDALSLFGRLHIEAQTPLTDTAHPQAPTVELHQEMQNFTTATTTKQLLQQQQPTPQQQRKLGRNDPCWCGSGKKYKHCHMSSDSLY